MVCKCVAPVSTVHCRCGIPEEIRQRHTQVLRHLAWGKEKTPAPDRVRARQTPSVTRTANDGEIRRKT
eukprot:m.78291 g.78291  ORF g.78291 m.78291 type:complete len:68 (+) comp8158_c0_seq4:892-1095(+)